MNFRRSPGLVNDLNSVSSARFGCLHGSTACYPVTDDSSVHKRISPLNQKGFRNEPAAPLGMVSWYLAPHKIGEVCWRRRHLSLWTRCARLDWFRQRQPEPRPNWQKVPRPVLRPCHKPQKSHHFGRPNPMRRGPLPSCNRIGVKHKAGLRPRRRACEVRPCSNHWLFS